MAAQTEPTLCEHNLNGNGAYMSERLPVLRFPHETAPPPTPRLPALENG